MKDIDLNKVKELAIKAAAGSFPVPAAYEQPRIYSDAEISYLAFAAAVTPAAFLAIVNDLQAEVATKQQNVDYLADRLPEAQHNGMVQLSQQLADAQELLRGTQEKLGKALVRNSEYAGELSRRDTAAGEPVAWEFLGGGGKWLSILDPNDALKYDYKVRGLYTAAQPAALPPERHFVEEDWSSEYERTHMLGQAKGWHDCREATKALGCQPVPVVKLPARFKPKVSSLLGNHAAIMASNSDGGWVNLKGVIEALDASGIKWEVEHETSD